MERRLAPYLQAFLQVWREQTGAAASVLSTTDGRWAIVSTMVTAVIAGSIAWLASDAIPSSGRHAIDAERSRSLMPYDLFMRLASQGSSGHAAFAAFGPSASIVANPAQSVQPDYPLDNALAAEQADQDNSAPNTRTVTLDSGGTLVGALTNAGVSSMDANSAVLALAKVFSPRSIKTGQSFDLTFEPAPPQTSVAQITYTPPGQSQEAADDDTGDSQSADAPPTGKLLSISFSPTVDRDITISRGADGAFGVQNVQKTLLSRYHRAGATIDSSLYLAAMQAGIPADVVVEMIHMFSYEVDFQRDIHPGDRFEVFYNYYYTPEGQPAKDGNIAYATMKLADRTVTLYRFQTADGEADYFDSKGQSARSMLMKTPVDGARISSGFGMRFHPVLGYTRMHKGIDFAVPVGTPVMAAGSGTIKSEGWAGGYGNFMLINHGNGYATAYGHLSRFAPGVHPGSRVHQGQVVAYSGNTGLTTGPHLHYEIRINDIQVNPATVKVAGGRKLAGNELRDFLGSRLHVDSELASMPLESKIADGGDLRAAKD